MILTLTLNPSVDKVLEIPDFRVDAVNHIRDTRTTPGGKGVNVGMLLGAMGREVTAMGITADGPGRFVERQLQDQGVTTAFTRVEGKTRTNHFLIDGERNTLTAIRGPGPDVTSSDLARLRRSFEGMLAYADMVVMAGSLPPGVAPGFYAELTRIAHERGVRVVANMREANLDPVLSLRPFFAAPDLRSVDRYGEIALDTREGRLAALDGVAHHAELAMLSAGGEVLLAQDDERFELLAPACDLKGRIRLDDALIAGVVDAVLDGRGLEDAAREGMAAALAVAGAVGGLAVSREDVECELDQVEVRRV